MKVGNFQNLKLNALDHLKLNALKHSTTDPIVWAIIRDGTRRVANLIIFLILSSTDDLFNPTCQSHIIFYMVSSFSEGGDSLFHIIQFSGFEG